MTRFLLLLFALICITLSYGQSKPLAGPPRQLTEEEMELGERNRDCIFSNKLSSRQRSALYPFNKAFKVQIASFDKPDSLIESRLPLEDKKVDYSRLKEVKTLDKNQTDSVSNILYNYVYRGVFHTEVKSHCYSPRNAIIFLDSRNSCFAFIEICFECQESRTSSEAVETGDFCTQKYDLLEEFFLKNGIEFGSSK